MKFTFIHPNARRGPHRKLRGFSLVVLILLGFRYGPPLWHKDSKFSSHLVPINILSKAGFPAESLFSRARMEATQFCDGLSSLESTLRVVDISKTAHPINIELANYTILPIDKERVEPLQLYLYQEKDTITPDVKIVGHYEGIEAQLLAKKLINFATVSYRKVHDQELTNKSMTRKHLSISNLTSSCYLYNPIRPLCLACAAVAQLAKERGGDARHWRKPGMPFFRSSII